MKNLKKMGKNDLIFLLIVHISVVAMWLLHPSVILIW